MKIKPTYSNLSGKKLPI